MIHEVDSALRALIEREAVGRGDVEVVFDAPTRDWAGRRNAPTIDVYLYDIREDLRRRERGMLNEYDADERRDRRPAPAAPVLQAVLPGHRLDPAARGRAPAAVGAAHLLPALRRAARGPAHRAAGRAGPAGAGDGRPAAAGGPGLRRRLVGAGRRAQAVARRRGQRPGRHRPALRDRAAGHRRRRGSASAAATAGRRRSRPGRARGRQRRPSGGGDPARARTASRVGRSAGHRVNVRRRRPRKST